MAEGDRLSFAKTLHNPVLELTGGSLSTWGLTASHQSQGLKVAGSYVPMSPWQDLKAIIGWWGS